MFLAGVLSLCLLAAVSGCGSTAPANEAPRAGKSYGVFLSVTDGLDRLQGYETVVIDAQYFSKQDIAAFQRMGHRVYTYLNVGSLEDFRDYYDTYRDLTLAPYENWDEEAWVDVSDMRWQRFLTDELIPDLLEKGVDGFFVDNCDVYYNYPTAGIMDGLTTVLRTLIATGKAVLINSGDTYLDAYCDSGGQWSDVITGINQEGVFSSILWDEDAFGTATPEDHAYFTAYIEKYAAMGADIYLLEYTEDADLIAEIGHYCAEHRFAYYISDSLELD